MHSSGPAGTVVESVRSSSPVDFAASCENHVLGFSWEWALGGSDVGARFVPRAKRSGPGVVSDTLLFDGDSLEFPRGKGQDGRLVHSSRIPPMFLVVGSGPAGVSGAKALLRQGRRVTMIDVGLNLEPARGALLDRIALCEVEAWDPIEVAALKGAPAARCESIQVKLAFGSDYPYRSATESLGLSIPDGTFKPSFARGGASTVWGASAMPL